ncbi:hypothetical protein CsSME_00000803 [Camellia sinensis var. sinensis]
MALPISESDGQEKLILALSSETSFKGHAIKLQVKLSQ